MKRLLSSPYLARLALAVDWGVLHFRLFLLRFRIDGRRFDLGRLRLRLRHDRIRSRRQLLLLFRDIGGQDGRGSVSR